MTLLARDKSLWLAPKSGAACTVAQARFKAAHRPTSLVVALNLENAKVTGGVILHQFVAEGQVTLYAAEIRGNLVCEETRLQNPAAKDVPLSGMALNAQGTKITRAEYLRKEFAAEGRVWLFAAQIEGDLDCRSGKFQNKAEAGIAESGLALSVQGAKVAGTGFLGNQFAADGQVWLSGAVIGGDLNCDGGVFDNPGQGNWLGGIALTAQNLKVGGTLSLRYGFTANGQIQLYGVEIGRDLSCDGGTFHNPPQAKVVGTGMALVAEGAKVKGSVYLRPGFVAASAGAAALSSRHFRAEGLVRLVHMEIGGDVDCHGA